MESKRDSSCDLTFFEARLFDIADPKVMRGISSVRLVDAYSPVLQDHRAVRVLLSRGLALIPLSVQGDAGGSRSSKSRERL